MSARSSQKTGIVYCRTSTTAQKDADTIEAQRVACKRLVKAHGVQLLAYGAKGDGWIEDNGRSGSLLEGRAFSGLIDDLQAGKVRPDYLIVYSMSRLARHDKSSTSMVKLVKSATDKARIQAVLIGARVEIIDSDGINDPASVITEIKETLSGEEYRLIRKRTMDGKARVLGNGARATGGRVPYGYTRVYVNGKDKKQGTSMAPCPVDGPRFTSLMTWFIEGGVSFASRKAQEAGWPAPRGGATWYPASVQQILNHLDHYTGESTLHVDGRPFVVTYPALLDPKSYAAIARRRKETTLAERAVILSTGMVDCSCGSHVHGHKSRATGKFFVGCRKLKRQEGQRCGTMADELFSAKVWQLVCVRLTQIEDHKLKSASDRTISLEAATAKLVRIQEQLDRAVTMHLEGDMDKASYNTTHKRLRGEKTVAQQELAEIKRTLTDETVKRVGELDVKATASKLLLTATGMPLESRRTVLADILQGSRAILTWKKSDKGHAYATLTLPEFAGLKPLTVRLDHDVAGQIP